MTIAATPLVETRYICFVAPYKFYWSHRSIGTDIVTICEDDERACKVSSESPFVIFFWREDALIPLYYNGISE